MKHNINAGKDQLTNKRIQIVMKNAVVKFAGKRVKGSKEASISKYTDTISQTFAKNGGAFMLEKVSSNDYVVLLF